MSATLNFAPMFVIALAGAPKVATRCHPELQRYTVAAALYAVISIFGSRSFTCTTALGYLTSPASGRSFEQIVQFQKDFIYFFSKLVDVERHDCLRTADLEFRRTLAYVGQRFIATFLSDTPTTAVLNLFLPEDCVYEEMLNGLRECARPIANLRKHFP
eukprot:6204792-Pleurochrysis_carterae.AAC.1